MAQLENDKMEITEQNLEKSLEIEASSEANANEITNDASYTQRTLTTDDAAQYLNIDKSIIYLARSRGQVAADKRGRSIFFSRADLDALKKVLDAQAAAASQEEPLTIPEGSYSTDDAAAYLGIHKSAIYQARSQGRLNAEKIGRLVYFTKEALDAFKEDDAKRKTEDLQFKAHPQEYAIIQKLIAQVFENSPPQTSITKIEEAQKVRAWHVQLQTPYGATRKTIILDGNQFHLL